MAVAIKQVPGKEVPTEVLAEAIVAISKGIAALRAGQLTERALLLLIQDAAPTINYRPISIREIKAVLAGMESMEKLFVKKRPVR